MGRAKRPSPKKLGKKLLRIRKDLGFTQPEMAEALKARIRRGSVYPGHVSAFERGERDPSTLILLAYARLAGVTMESLADDELELPSNARAKSR